jgi:hydrogenase expression/formation protein HypD
VRFVDEFRDPARARAVADAIRQRTTRPWTLMEICGGQTHSILRYGVDQLLPQSIRLVHGPGCPVCVTPIELIDRAIAMAKLPRVVLTSYGDMLRVPGSHEDLLRAKSAGADVRMVYSPLDSVNIAATSPDREVVFFAVGFETTAPANAMAVLHAAELGLTNFSMLSAHVLVPPAMRAILDAPDNIVQAFLAAGHVCTIMGTRDYQPLAEQYHIPIVVTGFEPLDLLQGIYLAVAALEQGRSGVENQYARSVTPTGNRAAQEVIKQVFHVCDRNWRGIGVIANSGLELRPELASFNAAERFKIVPPAVIEASPCRAGDVLRGVLRPPACAAFGLACTPERPLGAPMVSSEGACSAYFRYRRQS